MSRFTSRDWEYASFWKSMIACSRIWFEVGFGTLVLDPLEMFESLDINLRSEKGFFVIYCTIVVAPLLVWAVFKGSSSVGFDWIAEVEGAYVPFGRMGEGLDWAFTLIIGIQVWDEVPHRVGMRRLRII